MQGAEDRLIRVSFAASSILKSKNGANSMKPQLQNLLCLTKKPAGFSLAELMAVLVILGVLAILIVPRVANHQVASNKAACYANQGDIELQVKLWKRLNGSYPAANLSNIGPNTTYFPSGLPTCPVDGTSYTIDTTTGNIIGHTH
jgi:prepilin-type N-terminal cleavage/methylation domain-containing protein